jgi:hypothetical protein
VALGNGDELAEQGVVPLPRDGVDGQRGEVRALGINLILSRESNVKAFMPFSQRW